MEEKKPDRGYGQKRSYAAVTENEEKTDLASYTASKINNDYAVLLATAQVRIKVNGDWSEPIRALIDQGSMASFISEGLVKNLKLNKIKNNVSVTGIAGEITEESKGSVDLEIIARYPTATTIKTRAIVLNKLISVLPGIDCDDSILKNSELKGLILADPILYQNTRVDLILGADVFCEILLNGIIKSSNGGLLAQETIFGWILSGSIKKRDTGETKNNKVITLIATVDELNENIKKFWELERVKSPQLPQFNSEDEYCMKYFNDTIRRNAEGRYIVSLPFKDNSEHLGNSKRMAMAQMFQLERRFMANKNLKKQYTAFINEYIAMGHMVKCSDEKILDAEGFYLPHHAIFKESTTTKLRVVFDASRKTSRGISLNEKMMIGPRLQEELFNIMIRFCVVGYTK